ncbi:MAG TPA: family 16 glycosylhydrolase [Polyangiaceae bacterium]|jgi:hypothetical protein|nr:family 16 glycosylhydrolase [Polyangiaceae bacterium]
MKYRCLSLGLAAASLTLAAEAGAVASAELYQNQTYTYGRFEARVRFAAGDGVISSFFLWKPGSEMPGTFWNELDFEKLGADCHLQTNPLYGLPVVDHSAPATLDADLCGEYHTYTFEWTPSYIAYLVDGVEVRRDGEETAAAFAENAATGMQIHFNIWPGDASFGGNFDAAILPVHQYVSWVQYSSFADGAFTPEWREEFDGSTLPNGWAVGTWASPKNLSTHQPANVTLSTGTATLSLTADDATGLVGAPPPDLAAGSDAAPDPTASAGDTPGAAGGGGASSAAGTGASGDDQPSATGGGASSSGPTAEAAGGGAIPYAAPSGLDAAPTASGESSSCSYVVSVRARPDAAVWLTLGAVTLFARRRRRDWLERGRRRPGGLG